MDMDGRGWEARKGRIHGPRHSGKTTLAQMTERTARFAYLSLDDAARHSIEPRSLITQDLPPSRAGFGFPSSWHPRRGWDATAERCA